MSAPRDDFRPTASWEMLRRRAGLLRQVRAFFEARGFLEVETPILSADTVVDRHLDPLAVTLPDDPRRPEAGRRLWLQTSPEFGMKRLLAAGGEAIYQVTRAFRGGERGRHHNPEFTMIEWYRRGDSYEAGMELLAEFAAAILGMGPAEGMTYSEAFLRHVGVEPHAATTAELAAAARRLAVPVPESLSPEDRDGWLNVLLAAVVEPRLGENAPTILCDWPASQAALARVRGAVPPVAERFELYARGIELANGYHELVDPRTLRERAMLANAQRRAEGKPSLPEESRLLAAMEHGLPACCGAALGFDRLVMVASGATTLAEVMAFPVDRA
jgi:lysyl-tRNA synthetase class 2